MDYASLVRHLVNAEDAIRLAQRDASAVGSSILFAKLNLVLGEIKRLEVDAMIKAVSQSVT